MNSSSSSSNGINSISLFRRKTTAISLSFQDLPDMASPSALHHRPPTSSYLSTSEDEELPLHRRQQSKKHASNGSGSYRVLFSGTKRRRKNVLSFVAVVVIISTIILFTLFGGGSPSDRGGKNTKRNNGRILTSPFQSFLFASSSLSYNQEPIPNDWVVWDVIIVGAGPAGLTAALFTARAGLSTLVLGSPAAGQLSQTKHLDNFPSFDVDIKSNGGGGGGPGWLETTKQQTLDFGTEFVPPGINVKSILGQDQTHHGLFVLETDESFPSKFTTLKSSGTQHSQKQVPTKAETSTLLRSWSVIVASGATSKQLNLQPNEKELWGTSLHSCAICDGHLYTNKRVVVVGGGDAAVDAALMLSRFASKVVVVHRRTEFSSVKNHVNLELMESTSNIEIKTPYVVESWEVHDVPLSSSPKSVTLKGAKVKRTDVSEDDSATELLQVDGGFIMIGAKPNTDWLTPQLRPHQQQKQQVTGENDEKFSTNTEMTPTIVDIDTEGLIRVGSPAPASTASTTTSTSVEGIFAAGEVVDKVYKQAITASAQGAQAAIDAERWLREKQHQRQIVGSLNDNAITLMTNQIKKQQQERERRQVQTVEEDQYLGQKEVEGSAESASNRNNCDLKDEQCIRRLVSSNPVVVFSKSWCPYCRKAMEALSLAGINEPHIVDLTQRQDAVEIQATLQQMTGRRTVPNVFVGGKSIGGGDETSALQRQGRLVPLLQSAGAFVSSTITKEDRSVHPPKQRPASTSHQRTMKGDEVTCDLLADECFDETIKKHPVIMFSLSWCPECKRSLELFDRIGVPRPFIVDLDDHRPIALNIRDHMFKRTGRNQVPNLWIGGDWVGGYALIQEKHSLGELLPMFEKVGIVPKKQR